MDELRTASVATHGDATQARGSQIRRIVPPRLAGRRAAQLMAAGGIVLATLAVAAPVWAGPMSGC